MNIRVLAKYIGLSAAMLTAGAAHAESRPFMPHGQAMSPPPGYLDLCQRDEATCGSSQSFASLAVAPAAVLATSSVGEGRPTFLSGSFLTPFPRAQRPADPAPADPEVDPETLAVYEPMIDETFAPAGEMHDFAAPEMTLQTAPETAPAPGAMAWAAPVAPPPLPGPVPRSQMKLLNTINQAVNREVHKATDFDLYGLLEYWSLPRVIDGKMYGDCEDYALEKRRRLIEAGVPAENLSMAVAVTARGESHAVLVVATETGDVVLDNLTPWATPWQDLNYHWVERQIAGGADWVSIG